LNAIVGGKEEEKNFEEGKKKFHCMLVLSYYGCRSGTNKMLVWSGEGCKFGTESPRFIIHLREILQSPELILEQHIQEKI
jgi:hypothetical protein